MRRAASSGDCSESLCALAALTACSAAVAWALSAPKSLEASRWKATSSSIGVLADVGACSAGSGGEEPQDPCVLSFASSACSDLMVAAADTRPCPAGGWAAGPREPQRRAVRPTCGVVCGAWAGLGMAQRSRPQRLQVAPAGVHQQVRHWLPRQAGDQPAWEPLPWAPDQGWWPPAPAPTAQLRLPAPGLRPLRLTVVQPFCWSAPAPRQSLARVQRFGRHPCAMPAP